MTAASTRARCGSDEDYQPSVLPTDSAEDPELGAPPFDVLGSGEAQPFAAIHIFEARRQTGQPLGPLRGCDGEQIAVESERRLRHLGRVNVGPWRGRRCPGRNGLVSLHAGDDLRRTPAEGDEDEDEDVLQVAALDVPLHTVKATCEGLVDAVKSASRASDSSPRRSLLPSSPTGSMRS